MTKNCENLLENITAALKLCKPLFVLSKEIEGRLYSNFEFNLPVQILNSTPFSPEEDHKVNFLKKNFYFKESGLYIFRPETGKIALGSALNFQRRFLDYTNYFNN